MMMRTKFYLHYELGVHHLDIETTDKDFYRVINDLSTEFEIHTSQACDDNNSVTYSITNYYGDEQTIGYNRDEDIE